MTRRSFGTDARQYGIKVHRGPLATVYECPCCGHTERAARQPGAGPRAWLAHRRRVLVAHGRARPETTSGAGEMTRALLAELADAAREITARDVLEFVAVLTIVAGIAVAAICAAPELLPV